MAKSTIQTAIVITGAPKEHVPLFNNFAYCSFPDVREIELIQYDQAEVAFISKPAPTMRAINERQWHHMRDIVETRVKQAFIKGIRECVLIPWVPHNPEDEHFDVCTEFLRHERDRLLKWAPFTAVAGALFTVDGRLIPLDLESG